jgi:hypothetical protein
MMKKYQGEANHWLLNQVGTWEAKQVDQDETEDEGTMDTGSKSLPVSGLGMLGVNGGGSVVASA